MATMRPRTHRISERISFTDLAGTKCSVQESVLATEHAVWLGVTEARPQLLVSKSGSFGSIWAEYPLHEDVHIQTQMHLSKKQVKELISILQEFIEAE